MSEQNNTVTLSDGRVIELRESTGADEMIVAAQLGKTFELNGGGALIFQSCMTARCIATIDGKPPETMRSFEAYRDFLASFKGKDLTKIKNLYQSLNGDDEEGKSLEEK